MIPARKEDNVRVKSNSVEAWRGVTPLREARDWRVSIKSYLYAGDMYWRAMRLDMMRKGWKTGSGFVYPDSTSGTARVALNEFLRPGWYLVS
jgi:hypothetical protein